MTFQFESQTFKLLNWQLFKYSAYARENYMFSDLQDCLPKDLYDLQEKSDVNTDNIIYFFQLLQNNFEIGQNVTLTYKQFIDLINISEYLKTKKLLQKLITYFNYRKVDPNFIIEILLHQTEQQKDTDNFKYEIRSDFENILITSIDDCFLNENFLNLTVPIIYRIVEQSYKKKLIKSDNLYDFINKSIDKLHILFRFVDVFDLSDERLDHLLSFI